MSKLSEIERKFLQLLHSDQEENVNLALEMGKGIPELCLKERLEAYQNLYRYFFGDTLLKLEAKHIIKLKLDPEEQVFSFPYPSLMYKVWKDRGIPANILGHEFVSDIKVFRGLTLLELENRCLGSLPKEIGELTKLQEIKLKDNRLAALPLEFTKLTQLHSLDLSKNSLDTIPQAIYKLAQLQKLKLGENSIKAVPKEIKQLKSLTLLDLSKTSLESLPVEIGQLKNLEYLDLSNTCLTAFPLVVVQLENLKTLNLNGNKISRFPWKIRRLKNLKELYISSYFWGIFKKLLLKYYLPKCKIHIKQRDLSDFISVNYLAKKLYKTNSPFLHRCADVLLSYQVDYNH
ncbi:hypothetical protein BKI52_20490 [marine bacterium AO1-C]|nr:hypothetical protein BKI52_20490 [marine bacterium AO1-C]